METIIKIELPLKKINPIPASDLKYLPWRVRWMGWLFTWSGGSVQEFGGSRVNRAKHLSILRWHILTIHRNEYHDRSDKERADEYLNKWSECEKQLQMFRLASLGEGVEAEVKKVIRDSLGVDLDEGTTL